MSSKVYQVSLLQALVSGYYDGIISVKKLKDLGDVGIGTFTGADGELIMLANKVYKAKIDGKIEIASNDELIPFCNATAFFVDDRLNVSCRNIIELKNILKEYKENFKNLFMVIRINGLFKQITVRSLPKQTKPYKPLDYIVENEQKIYTYNNIKGTVIGFCAPEFIKDLNTIDFHMHFIDIDKSVGGHILDLAFDNIDIDISLKNEFGLILSKDDAYINSDFKASNDKIKKVEE